MRSDDDEKRNAAVKEFELMKRLDHENIVRVHDCIQVKGTVYIVMELVEGMELFEAIASIARYCEDDARKLFYQILQAIKYMHQNGVCHRDIKPSNIMVAKKKKIIKVTDFNISKFANNESMQTLTGTETFKAPEMLSGKEYSTKVDIWSAGCVLFTLLIGQQPFLEGKITDLHANIKAAKLKLENGPEWKELSTDA
jgi:calcium/calmodulin-dependent protein kinase I